MGALHQRVAERCIAAELPITAAGVEEVDRMLREERGTVTIDRESDPGSWADAMRFPPFAGRDA